MVKLPDVEGEWSLHGEHVNACASDWPVMSIPPGRYVTYRCVEPKPMPEPESEGYFVSQLGNFLANEKWYLAAQMIYDQIKRSREP